MYWQDIYTTIRLPMYTQIKINQIVSHFIVLDDFIVWSFVSYHEIKNELLVVDYYRGHNPALVDIVVCDGNRYFFFCIFVTPSRYHIVIFFI